MEQALTWLVKSTIASPDKATIAHQDEDAIALQGNGLAGQGR